MQLIFIHIFNRTNKERVALEGHLIHSLHGPVPRRLRSCPALYSEDDTPPLLSSSLLLRDRYRGTGFFL